jgi:hypothetical protein
VLISEWKSGNVSPLRRGYALVSTGREKLWILSKLRFCLSKGDLLKILAADVEEQTQKNNKTGVTNADSLMWQQLRDQLRHK